MIRAYVRPVRRSPSILCGRIRLIRLTGKDLCRGIRLTRYTGKDLCRGIRLTRFTGKDLCNRILRKQKPCPGIRKHIVYPLLRIVQVYGQIGSPCFLDAGHRCGKLLHTAHPDGHKAVFLHSFRMKESRDPVRCLIQFRIGIASFAVRYRRLFRHSVHSCQEEVKPGLPGVIAKLLSL